MKRFPAAALFFIMTSLTAYGTDTDFNPDPDFAQVEAVRILSAGSGRWDVHVTVRHNDEGWDHYADIWQVVDPATGEVLGERILAHPHDTEQPFTRSLTGLELPGKISEVRIRSRCNRHGYEGRSIIVKVPRV